MVTSPPFKDRFLFMKNEICVAEGALAAGAEAGGNVAPSVGDEVDFTGRGKVTRAENGQIYFEATEINGEPVMGQGNELAGESEEAALDAEVGGMMGGGGMPGMLLFLLAFLVGLAIAKGEPLADSRERTCTGGAVSNHVIYAKPTQGFDVEINNFSGNTLYLLVFDSATNQLAGAVPHFTAAPIATGTSAGKFWVTGAPFRYGVNVCLSQTPFSLTNATTGGTVTLIHSPLRHQ